MLQDFFLEVFKILDFSKCLQYFLFRDCILSLLLKSKVGSLKSFSLSFPPVLFLPLTIRKISGKVLRNHKTWMKAHLQIRGLLLLVTPLIFVTFETNYWGLKSIEYF